MAKLLGIDVGRVRVGIAVADSETGIIFPRQVLKRAKGVAEASILKLLAEEGITEVVVGLPLDVDGGRTAQCDDVELFARRLSKRAQIKIHFVDEHLSSVAAGERGEQCTRGSKGEVDALAAAVILESFIAEFRKV